MSTTDQDQPATPLDTTRELIVSLSAEKQIVQFNKQSEQYTGYSREEVLQKTITDVLSPSESLEQWNSFFESITQTLWVDNVTLPIKTKHHDICMINWSGYLIKNKNGSIKAICLYGRILASDQQQKPQNTTPVQTILSEKEKTPPADEDKQQKQQSIPNEDRSKSIIKKIQLFPKGNDPERRQLATDKKDQNNLLEDMQRTIRNTAQQIQSMDSSLQNLLKKQELSIDCIKKLENQQKQQMKMTILLGDYLKLFSKRNKQDDLKQPPSSHQEEPDDSTQMPPSEKTKLFSNLLGFKRRHQNLNSQLQQLATREKQLQEFEAQMLNEQKILTVRIEEFSRWSKQLELLESEIEKRRRELMEQEETLLPKTSFTSEPTVPAAQKEPPGYEVSGAEENTLLDNFSQSAVIIQRGILKQVNDSFAALLGYDSEELIEKSFFELIASDGLAEVERYYLNRLKGEGVSTYKTFFSTKDETTIPVQIHIKQSIYNGEKAEIAIITSLDETQPDGSLDNTSNT